MIAQWIIVSLMVQHICGTNIPSRSFSSDARSHLQRRTNPRTVIKAMEQLGISLSLFESRKMTSNQSNVVLSPLSISILLGVLLLASRKDTHRQLKKAMNLDALTDRQFHESFMRVLASLENTHNEVVLEKTSRLFIQFGLPLSSRFLQSAESLYNITIGGVNFASDGVEAKNIINQWVSDMTNNLIPNLFQKEFRPDTKLVAVNTVYFNGAWEKPFNPELTDPNGVFNVGEGHAIRIPMMGDSMDVKYVSHFMYRRDRMCDIGKFDMIALPYKRRQFSMYILKPRAMPDARNLALIEKDLNGTDCINFIISRMKREPVNVQIPRMKISSKVSLRESLHALGVTSLFDPSRVDLSGLSSSKGLLLDSIVHEASITIDEFGTEAVAATGTTVDRIGGNTVFKLNEPSIVFIRNDFNGVILFWAKVINPSVNEQDFPPLYQDLKSDNFDDFDF